MSNASTSGEVGCEMPGTYRQMPTRTAIAIAHDCVRAKGTRLPAALGLLPLEFC
jgi:hypothetical protein